METHESILQGCRDGIEKYQSHLYNLYSRKMFALCLYYSRDRMEAEDLLQDGFIKVFANIGQVRDAAMLDFWIRRVFINCALARYRKKNLLQFDSNLPESNIDTSAHTAIDTISAQELTAIIQTLSPQYQMVFNLYAIEGFSHKEISDMLGISENTSKSNLSRARTILQERVEASHSIKQQVVSFA